MTHIRTQDPDSVHAGNDDKTMISTPFVVHKTALKEHSPGIVPTRMGQDAGKSNTTLGKAHLGQSPRNERISGDH